MELLFLWSMLILSRAPKAPDTNGNLQERRACASMSAFDNHHRKMSFCSSASEGQRGATAHGGRSDVSTLFAWRGAALFVAFKLNIKLFDAGCSC
jgi:hypothetical protein